jgi:chorismate mutase
MVLAVRGATGVRENDATSIQEAVRQLIRQLLSENRIEENQIVSIMFSQTKDLTKANPATAVREDGYAAVPLFCSQEPEYEGSMPRVIRALITYNTETQREVTPVYINGAEALRSDIFES